MFQGFFSGNNPASVVCLHEMGWFPLIQSLYPAGSAGLLAVQREFEYFSRCGWDNGALRNGTDSPYVSCTIGAGGMVHRLASNGFYNAPWGALQDQNPHFIIGVHALATATGDAAAARRLLPAVLAVADYLEANGLALTPREVAQLAQEGWMQRAAPEGRAGLAAFQAKRRPGWYQ